MPGLLFHDSYLDSYSGRIENEYYDASHNWVGVTYQNRDGSGEWFLANGEHGSWSAPNPGYWQLGASLGLGFEIWGTNGGAMGFEWLTGVGIVAESQPTATPQEALAAPTPQGVTVTHTVDAIPSTISWDPAHGLTLDGIGVNFGVLIRDPDPGTTSDNPNVPFNNDSPIP